MNLKEKEKEFLHSGLTVLTELTSGTQGEIYLVRKDGKKESFILKAFPSKQ